MKIHQIERDADAFQQPVDERDLRRQLERELPDEDVREVTELEAGLFNNTYRVDASGNAYILKVAPVSEAEVFYNERHLMARERSVMHQLQALGPLIPDYLSFFTVDGREAFLQRLIPGRLWHDVIDALSEAENARLWNQLGTFARRVHGCRGERFGYPAPFRNFDRWSRFIADNVAGMVDDCRRLGVMGPEIEEYCRLLPRFSETLDQVKTASLLHGDLWPRNVIIEGAGAEIRLKAVIDAERAFWGDPLSDWVLILYGVPDAFWEGYGEHLLATQDPARIAIYRGMYFILNILESVRFKASAEKFREHLRAANRELERHLRSTG